MYAIIKTGGKQYTVKPGDVLRVEKMEADLGSELKCEVLMVGGEKTFIGDKIGAATVTVVVTNQERGPKLVVFKKKRRQGYRRMGGHRQPYTELFVKSITNPEGQTANADTKPHVFDPEKKAERLAKSDEVRLAHKESARKARRTGEAVIEGATAKSPAKKAAPKKVAAKKSGAAKKKAGAKKSTGTKAKKKTAKK
jgi:large subunit ribosomal protein L21